MQWHGHNHKMALLRVTQDEEIQPKRRDDFPTIFLNTLKNIMHTNMKTLQAKRAEALALFVFMGLFAAMMGVSLWFSVVGK